MRTNIQSKITLVFSLIVALILLGIFVYLQKHLKEKDFQKIRTNLKSNLSLSAHYLENLIDRKVNYSTVDRIADTIGQDLNVRVTIIDSKGKVLGDSDLDINAISSVDNHLYRPEIQQALKTGVGESRRFSQTLRKELLYLAIPFKYTKKGESDGVIRLAVPLSEIKHSSRSLNRVLFISLGIAFLIALIFGGLASQYISKPIKEVSSISTNIAAGDFSRSVTIHSNDELGDLSTSINYMSAQIKGRIEEVVSGQLRLEAVLLSMFDGVVVVGQDGKIKLMNKSLRELLQVTEEVVGKKPIEVIRNVEIQEITTAVLESKTGAVSKEIATLFPEDKNLIIHATPVLINNEVDGAVLVFHDITELRRLETVRKDFVANVSHELRTPITNIKGYAETLLEGALGDQKDAEEFTKIIHAESERLAKLVEDVLDLSKIESGKMDLHFKDVDITSIISRVEKGLQKQINKKKIKFRIEVPKEIKQVKCDEPSISQVFLNLIENSIKYNNEGGIVTVGASIKGDHIEVSISDTGIGIPHDDMSRIFERFYRVDKAHSREIGGTGLGLSIVKHIIQAHKGDVHVTSQVGVGSTFRFTLPKA